MASNQGSHVTVNVSAPRGGKALDAIKRTSARSVVDGLARTYREGVMKRASKMTRDEYAVAPASTRKVVGTYSTEGGRYSYSVVQMDGVVSVVRSDGVNNQMDQGSYATGGSGETASLQEQTNQSLLDGKADDAVYRQLKRINQLNRKRGGSADMSAQAADEVWSGTPGSNEMVRGPTTNLPGEGDDGEETMDCDETLPATKGMQAGVSMDGNSIIRRMNARNRAAYGRWSPAPRKVVA